MSKSYFITGGLGFVGLALIEKIRSESIDSKIYVYDNDLHGRKDFLKMDKNTHLFENDIRDNNQLESCITMAQPDVVFHLAAVHFIPECIKNPKETRAINLGGTGNLINAINMVQDKGQPNIKMIFASSAAVYKDRGQTHTPFDENDPLEAIDIYGETKLESEVKIYDNAHFPATITRFFNIIGKNDPVPHLVPAILKQLKNSDSVNLGNTDPRRDYVAVTDVAKALYALANEGETPEIGEPQVFNIGTGKGASVVDVINRLSESTGRNLTINVDQRLVRPIDRMHLVSDISKINQATGWKPEASLSQSLENLLMTI